LGKRCVCQPILKKANINGNKMKFLKIQDQIINIDKIVSVYPNYKNNCRGVFINCGNHPAIFRFDEVNIDSILKALKKAKTGITEVEIIQGN
jgi:hypothetical protein